VIVTKIPKQKHFCNVRTAIIVEILVSLRTKNYVITKILSIIGVLIADMEPKTTF